MKLSLYACMLVVTVPFLSYGMNESNANNSSNTPQPQVQNTEPKKPANNLTSQEICRLTLYAIAEKRLGAKK